MLSNAFVNILHMVNLAVIYNILIITTTTATTTTETNNNNDKNSGSGSYSDSDNDIDNDNKCYLTSVTSSAKNADINEGPAVKK